ncbi:hypothetical protein LCGC14_1040210 [marine sediment metagenome]|uniref:Fibronectin type-III domain-containing protein n=1 Tax=marine sediment metagenome TaxID=412755 RepID=A0A0F9MWH2_9ZZZZ
MAAGDPTGPDLCSGTTDGDTLPVGSFEERQINMVSPITLTSGVRYAIVWRAPDAFNTASLTNSLNTTGYDGTLFFSGDSGSSWSESAGFDAWFSTPGDSYNPGLANDVHMGGVIWRSQSFVASSAYEISFVILKLEKRNGSWPVGTITVSIRATEPELPTKANTPAPTNANTSVTLDQATITWVDGGGADTFNVYYGTSSGSLTKVSDAQAGASFTVTGITNGSPYAYLSVRYWRIDSTNDTGTTTGDEWSFTTIRIDPPTKTYYYSTTGQYYYLLVQSDGSYGDVPGVGVENTDYVFLAAGYEANFVATTRKLVSCADSKVWIEDI